MPTLVDIDVTANGVTTANSDNTSALNTLLAGGGAGKRLVFPPGVYRHAGVITVGAASTVLYGPGATLDATDPANIAVHLTGNWCRAVAMTFTNSGMTTRQGALDGMKLTLQGVGNVVSRCRILSSGGAGIFCFGARSYMVVGNEVTGTLADGIHNTFQSSYGYIYGNTVRTTGDDGIAVVSYSGDGGLTHHITIVNNLVDTPGARGCSVVGGEYVTIRGNTIRASNAAGVLFASEVSFNTLAPKHITASYNRLLQCNTNASLEHGMIFVSGRTSNTAEDITLQSNYLEGPVGIAYAYMRLIDGFLTAPINVYTNEVIGPDFGAHLTIDLNGGAVPTLNGNTINGSRTL